MFEELVSEVQGTLKEGASGRTRLYLAYRRNGSMQESVLDLDEVGAVSTWLAQPKPRTPDQIAQTLVREWVKEQQIDHLVDLMLSMGSLQGRIAAALRTATEAKDV